MVCLVPESLTNEDEFCVQLFDMVLLIQIVGRGLYVKTVFIVWGILMGDDETKL